MAMKLLAILLIWWGLSFFVAALMTAPLNVIFGVLLIIDGVLILFGK